MNTKSISDLENDINSTDYLIFENDYVQNSSADYMKFDKGININNRELTIDGANYVIDCRNQCSVFNITQSTVILKNINFLNANYRIPTLEFIGGRYITPSYSWYGYGGFIHAKNSNITIINCTFINGTAKYAGALYAKNSKISIEYSIFSNCEGVNGGSGAVFIEDGYTVLKGSNFINNTSNTYGGGLTLSGNGELIGCEFKNNKANVNAGALLLLNGTILNCNFINNSCVECGGAVCIYDGEVKDSVFNMNNSTEDGSAVYSYCPMILNIFNCSFNNNFAKGKGTVFGAGKVVDCNFTNNHADYGSCIYFNHRDDFVLANTIIGSVFSHNKGRLYGGAVYSERINLTVKDTKFDHNVATVGGAIYVNASFVEFNNVIFENNMAYKAGINIAGEIHDAQIINSTEYPNSGIHSIDVVGNTTYLKLKLRGSEDGSVNIIISENNTINNTNNNIITNKQNTKNDNTVNPSKNNKVTPILAAKKTTFKVKTKNKKYSITLKTNTKKPIKNVKIYLKIKGKTYTVKTNKKGTATFKITNLKKKGTYKAKIIFHGNKDYNKISRIVKIKCK